MMGRCYDSRGRLVCDLCGKAEGTTRRRRCPVNYCPSADLCPECFKGAKASGEWAEWHRDCPKRSAEMHAREAREAELLAAGHALRCAALGAERVHVLFRYADGRTIGRYMPANVYRAIPLLVPATVEDFQRVANECGAEMIEAPADF